MAARGDANNRELPVATSGSDGDARRVVAQLHPNDVLVGRGAPTIFYEGNIRMRERIKRRKVEFMATAKQRVKQLIAEELYQEIRGVEGRFLRKVKDPREIGLPATSDVYLEVDKSEAIRKVKQALREQADIIVQLSVPSEPLDRQETDQRDGPTSNTAGEACTFGTQSSPVAPAQESSRGSAVAQPSESSTAANLPEATSGVASLPMSNAAVGPPTLTLATATAQNSSALGLLAPQMNISQPVYPHASLTPFQASHGSYPQSPPMNSGANPLFSPTDAAAWQSNQAAMQTNRLIHQAQVNAMLEQQLNSERQRLVLQTQALQNAQSNSGNQWSVMQQPFSTVPATSLAPFGMQPTVSPTSINEASQLLSSQSLTGLQSNQLVQQASLYVVLEQQRHDQNGRLRIMQNQPFLSNGPVVSMPRINNANSQLHSQPTLAHPSHTSSTTTTGPSIPMPHSDQPDAQRPVTKSVPSASSSSTTSSVGNGVEDKDHKPTAKSRSDNPEATSQ